MATTPSRSWREHPQRYRMEAAQCSKCDRVWFPPRRVCADCGGQEFGPAIIPEEGKVATWTIIRVGPAEFGDLAPYAIAVVEFENGVRMLSQVVDVDVDAMEIGMPVRIEFRRVTEDGEAGVLYYGYKCVPA
jgi:uncharacterized OB-fold protein